MLQHEIAKFYLEALLDRDEESVETIGLEQRFLLVGHDLLEETTDAVVADAVEAVCVHEEGQSIGIVDLVRAAIAG